MAKVSTSHVERQNLNMRMGMRRFTRLTNGFSKKVESQRDGRGLHGVLQLLPPSQDAPHDPGDGAGITDHEWSMEEVVEWMDALAPAPKKRGPYKKRGT